MTRDRDKWLPLPDARDADDMIDAATALVWAVRTGDGPGIDVAYGQVTADAGGVRALAQLLAAMVPDDESPRELMAWRLDPREYLRLRENGYCRHTATAAMLAQQSTRDAVADGVMT